MTLLLLMKMWRLILRPLETALSGGLGMISLGNPAVGKETQLP